ncbi:phage tail protein [Photobacterium frigidiphilum]
MDALTCSESLLQLMAWDRDITRFDSEPLLLFRMRVKYALINAKEAGSVAGFTRIFERMGIDIVAFKERVNRAQWDVCIIELTDGDISQNGKLVQTLIEQYGRTCRRYRLHVSFPSTLSIVSGVYAHNAALFSAKDDRLGALTVVPQPVEHIQHIYVAKLGGNA